jgi:hypothetical protein
MIGLNSGLIGKTNNPGKASAPGMWTPNEQVLAKRRDEWPIYFAFDIPAVGLQLALDASLPSSYPGSGEIWFDISGNGYHGNINTATYSSDFGGYISFSGGGNDYVTFSNYTQPAHSPTSSFSWSIFTRVFASPSDFPLLGNRQPTPYMKLTPNKLESQYGNLDSRMPGSQWMHNCIIKNGLNFTYYRNAEVVATLNSSNPYTYSTNPFYIGGDRAANEMLPCNVGQVLVYDVALSLADVTQIFNNSRARFEI